MYHLDGPYLAALPFQLENLRLHIRENSLLEENNF